MRESGIGGVDRYWKRRRRGQGGGARVELLEGI